MSTGRFVAPGKTRSCPHCRATILDSATVCPGCHHHLRFGSGAARPQDVVTPLRVEGTLRHPPEGGAWEYSVVLSIRNDRGEELARQVVGVGALNPADARTFSLVVEVFKPAEVREPKPQSAEGTAPRGAGDSRRAPDPRPPGIAAAAGMPTMSPASVRPGQAPSSRVAGTVQSGLAPARPGSGPGVGAGAMGTGMGAGARTGAGAGPGAEPRHGTGAGSGLGSGSGVGSGPGAGHGPAHVPSPAGGERGRPGLTSAWPDPLRPSSGRSGSGQSSGGSAFKEPRQPGSPGLQPKRRGAGPSGRGCVCYPCAPEGSALPA
jgi:hypothetical protein